MNRSTELRTLHSDIFNAMQLPGLLERPSNFIVSASGDHFSDTPPPLVTRSINSNEDSSPTSMNAVRNAPRMGVVSNTDNRLTVYDYHCKFAFMRSQLSRLLEQDGRSNVSCLSSSSDPTLYDFMNTVRNMDEESRDKLINILTLRIKNN